ncbi:MAG: hypothetical protein CMJ83_15120 [Planctomycetes bacterium]|nr:hypothetical protein [Planctomycetota bacterium]
MQMRTLILLALAASGSAAQTPDLYDETVLRTLELTFPQSNWYQLLQANYGTGVELEGDLTVDGVTYPSVGVRFRGYSSYSFIGSSQKKPFNISMNAFLPGQRLLGYKTLNLNNGFLDPTFVREVLCYHVFRNYLPCAKANWVVLRVNGVNWGVYVNVEQINKDMMREWFVDEDGARYEADATLPNATQDGSALTWLGTATPPYENNYELKNTVNDPWSPLIDTCDVLNNTPLANLEAAVQPKLAVDAALWMLACQIVFVNPDSYLYFGHNYWLYHDLYHDRIQGLPHGMNMTLAATSLAGSSTSARINFDLFYGESNTNRPLMNKLFAVPELRQRYLAHARTLLDVWWDWSILGPRIATYQALIASEVAADTKKLYPTSAFTSNVTTNYSQGWFTTITGLQTLVAGRKPYLENHPELSQPAPTITAVSHQPVAPSAGQAIWVNATVVGPSAPVGNVSLFTRVQGAFASTPMFDDGLHMDGAAGDGVWGEQLPTYSAGSTVQYYTQAVTAAAQGGAMAFSPASPELNPFEVVLPIPPGTGSIVINEFVAKNDTGAMDEMGEFEDWLELYNPTGSTVDVSGLYLTDNLAFPTKWQIPAGNLVPSGDTLLIWADDEPGDGPLHATFKLSAAGESIGLYATDGVTLLDGYLFGPQVADVATGALFDGGPLRVSLLTPTPDALNDPMSCGVRGYSALLATAHAADLGLTGSPAVGASSTLQVSNSAAGELTYLFVSLGANNAPVPGSPLSLLLAPGSLSLLLAAPTDGTGALDLPITLPNDPAIAGAVFYLQAVTLPAGAPAVATNGIEVTICP